ncbi:MAG: 2,3-bisphosphoglycerate-independent phosphoglycerate mutase [Candidatus Endonucleobacter bathymodioli]|uniref:2,3-bisphosphoglycerate-independent phosphoglycerate mutase n=1 Tax=Candidatus Endonucleibacter bathymodioli TaxID=539814 RepID=A0AA90NKJ6_9GAMM|nr:2,3-bisphosphoglycerate-independent phosphoglycerate mutase [Candidatus Endonucleobacter bathymodioli]
MTQQCKPTALIILDGYGYREETNSNAIYAAETPIMDKVMIENPNSRIFCSGQHVGLPEGQMGNSEVGHMNLGAGRTVYQDFTRITKDIKNGSFFENKTLIKAIDTAVYTDKAIHVMGLLSPGGVHSHEDHIHAIIEMASQRGAKKVYVHAFLDGRDTPPRSARQSLVKLDEILRSKGIGRISSLIGRYFAMDRDNRWDRVKAAYELITEGKSEYTYKTAVEGLSAAYDRNENDEFVQATVISDKNHPASTAQNGDVLIFMNFRSDRAREITRSFVERDFSGFQRKVTPALADVVTLTRYAEDIPATYVFPPAKLINTIGEYMERLGKTQLRIAETEKYAHVTFFFSGGRETPYKGETRILVPSPDVSTYDMKPEMSAFEVTDKLVDEIKGGKHDLIVCNFANCDMVGHTGMFNATVKAVEAVDTCVGRIIDALKATGGQCLITADHGNAEQMMNPDTGQAHTAHTCEPVPLIYSGPKSITLTDGKLSDIAPTLLALMELEQPEEMTGRSCYI